MNGPNSIAKRVAAAGATGCAAGLGGDVVETLPQDLFRPLAATEPAEPPCRQPTERREERQPDRAHQESLRSRCAECRRVKRARLCRWLERFARETRARHGARNAAIGLAGEGLGARP